MPAQSQAMKEWRISSCLQAVLLTLPFAPPAIATTPRESGETLMIVVVDNAGLSPSEATVMRRMMRTLLRYSGIRLEWEWQSKSGPRLIDPAMQSAGVPRIEIEIQRYKPARYTKDPLVLGMTTLGTNRATLHLAEIERLNGVVPVGLGTLMGLAAIHEIGHTLLGREHNRLGAMTPKWGKRDVDLMLHNRMPFTSAQSQALREELRRRRVQLEQVREAGASVVASDADGAGPRATPAIKSATPLLATPAPHS